MFEPLVLLLVVVALPRGALERLLGLRDRFGVLASAVVAAIGGLAFVSGIPVLGWGVSTAAAAVVVLLELVAWLGPERSARARWLGLMAVAGASAVFVDRSVGVDMLAHGGGAALWLLDLFNQLFLLMLAPILHAFGLGSAQDFVLDYFAPTLVFLSDHLFGLVCAGMIVFAILIYETIRGRVPSLPPLPPPFASESSRWLALLAVPLYGITLARPDWTLPWATWELCAAALLLRGLAVLVLFAQGSVLFTSLVVPFIVLAVLHPQLLSLLVVLSIADSLLGLSGFAHRVTTKGDRFEGLFLRSLSALRRGTRPATLITLLVLSRLPGMALSDNPALASLVPPFRGAAPGALDEPREHVLSVPLHRGHLRMDAYELPNRPGSMPATGLTPGDVARACAERGLAPCTRDEWWWACSDGGRHRYMPVGAATDAGQRAAVQQLRDACNLAPSAGLAAAGSYERCRAPSGPLDLVGNAFEWVVLEGRDGFHGLVGADHRHGDDLTTSCDGVVVVHESQLALLDRSSLGGRCCG